MATSRTSSGVYLPSEVSADIWAAALEQSFVMQHATRTDLPGAGKTIQLITADGTAEFVGETERKPNDDATYGTKAMQAHKIALTQSFSDEFARDKAALYRALRPRMAAAVAKAFDLAALHGVGAPTGNFDTLAGSPEVSIDAAGSVYAGLLSALSSVSTAGGDVTGWGLAPAGEIRVLGEVDGNDRPLFTINAQDDGSIGSLLGRPVYRNRNIYQAAGGVGEDEVLGIAGEWTSAFWGQVEAIRYEEYGGPIFAANGDLVHAGRQDNMFSVICEVEVGFVVRDDALFARLTGTAGA